MSPEAQRKVIAESRGWTNVHWSTGGFGGLIGNPPNGVGHPVPNYPSDLNDMNEVENDLKSKDCHSYMCNLESLLGFNSGPGGWDMDGESMWAMVHASAAQRAEAFLRTLGKWDDKS